MKTIHQNIKLPALTSKKTLAKCGWSYVDSDFKNWGTDKAGPKTKEAKFAVLEMDKDGTFKQIFDSINPDTDSMVMSQEQIIHFCENNKDKFHDSYYANFFLFKVGSQFFVARVRVRGDGSLEVHIGRLSYDSGWYAERRHRVVVPQLALDPSETMTLSPSDTQTLCDLGAPCPNCGELVRIKFSK